MCVQKYFRILVFSQIESQLCQCSFRMMISNISSNSQQDGSVEEDGEEEEEEEEEEEKDESGEEEDEMRFSL